MALANPAAIHHSPACRNLFPLFTFTWFSPPKIVVRSLRDKPTRDALHAYLGGISKKLDCPPLVIGGVFSG
ncbi:MAG: hypothetical protein AB1705_18080 [Verrucomicrobiota bacterium]